MTELYQKYWNRIIESTRRTDDEIHAFRKFFVLVFVLLFVPNNLYLAEIPDAIYNPPRLSPFVFLSGFPALWFLWLLHVAVIVGLLLISLGTRVKLGGILASLSLLTLFGFQYSLGKIDHGIMLPATILFFSLKNWHSVQDKFLPIPAETFIALFLCFGMFTAGIQKAIHWVDLDTSQQGFLAWFYNGYFQMNRTELLANSVFKIPVLITEFMDYTAVILELSPFILLLIGKRILWKYWITIVCLFHLANLLLLNIPFQFHILVYLVFILPNFMRTSITKMSDRSISIVVLLIAVLQVGLLVLKGSTISEIALSSNEAVLYFYGLMWGFMLFLGVFSIIEEHKGKTSELI